MHGGKVAPLAGGGLHPSPATVSLLLNALVLLVSECSRGLFVASMFQLVLALSGGDAAFDRAQSLNAAAVASYNVGRLVAAPLWGAAADRLPFRAVYACALSVAAVGNLMYALAEARDGSVAVVAVSRAVVGLGSGVLGVSRAVVPLLTHPAERTGWYSLLSTAKFIGFGLSPVVALGFSSLPDAPSAAVVWGPHWDCFTQPAILLAAINVALLPLLWRFFDPTLTGRSPPLYTAAAAVTPALGGGGSAPASADSGVRGEAGHFALGGGNSRSVGSAGSALVIDVHTSSAGGGGGKGGYGDDRQERTPLLAPQKQLPADGDGGFGAGGRSISRDSAFSSRLRPLDDDGGGDESGPLLLPVTDGGRTVSGESVATALSLGGGNGGLPFSGGSRTTSSESAGTVALAASLVTPLPELSSHHQRGHHQHSSHHHQLQGAAAAGGAVLPPPAVPPPTSSALYETRRASFLSSSGATGGAGAAPFDGISSSRAGGSFSGGDDDDYGHDFRQLTSPPRSRPRGVSGGFGDGGGSGSRAGVLSARAFIGSSVWPWWGGGSSGGPAAVAPQASPGAASAASGGSARSSGSGSGGLMSDPLAAAGVALFIAVDTVSKGVMTLVEACAPALLSALGATDDPSAGGGVPSADGDDGDDDETATTALWFAGLGAVGLLTFALLALPRGSKAAPAGGVAAPHRAPLLLALLAGWWARHAPSDLALLAASAVVTALGALVMANPWPAPQTLPGLTGGAALVWSLGVPVTDVVVTTAFSHVVAGRAQGRWFGIFTAAGSVGRIALPLVTVVSSPMVALLLSAGLSAACVPAVGAYAWWRARRTAASAAAAA